MSEHTNKKRTHNRYSATLAPEAKEAITPNIII